MNNKVNTSQVEVQFQNLHEKLQRRDPPISHDDISRKTRHFGRRYSRPMVSRFIAGTLTPGSLGYRVITETIEALANVKIIFDGASHGAQNLQPGAESTPVN